MANKNGRPDFLTAVKAAGRKEAVALPNMEGVSVFVKSLSAAAFRRISEQSLKNGKSVNDPDAYDEEALNRKILAESLVDENDERLIPEGREHETEDFPLEIRRILIKAAFSINGIGDKAEGNV